MTEIRRRKTRALQLGMLQIGNGAPISIQSMLSVKTSKVDDAKKQIRRLISAGCDIIRFSVMDADDATAIKYFSKEFKVPFVADIHYDYKLAIAAIEQGIDGLRINPGNIGSRQGVENLVAVARERKIPIRIGVNSGSLPKDLLAKYGHGAQAMVEAALSHVKILEDLGYYEIKISVKASHIPLMLQSYRELSRHCDYPLHLGVTEAGTLLSGSIKSAMGLGILLNEGIGDTLRVSLSDDPVQEVYVARQILIGLGLRKGLQIVSCPTCGRTRINLISLAQQVEIALQEFKDKELTVAVMGCAVNGPGEAKEADFGIAGGNKEGLIFAHGEIIQKVPEDKLLECLVKLVRNSL
ncbi:MAG: flavodoxin-dependent (E)-4-hydroxy-3-methylbut-2-enyl-diphosphate synthase [Candidatus Cloacimonetes bacterium]|nr:flavodoxin-dependent (E)-4-hydroxy-3-methylbut-2-enyl-diphosphate synthase [Candidatus Cloacimonadota bacterium]MDY0299419.1 flavodoxin-dependent (E)-4-hydroxy-3-methylbut-2-enyl-diphosphate synthase [Candidatus Cloacimonadaceae bacterium]MCB5278333.1 flavodoxin-dependent (E)-4-hydroxy-3-methylbut-2-enyl-diphosphate synthase [Candidatus Cloacimonadota bacterium]MCK9331924.1 flavodoxin-dependent (E)-4-hydroxy-3-methylbut-2-enyl-diphosphate synthase [Candidatus Cloacimonadota bacterium]MDD2210